MRLRPMALLLVMCISDGAAADVATIPVAASGDDGTVSRYSSVYSTMCTGSGTGVTSSSGIGTGPGDEYVVAYKYYKPIFVFDLTSLSGTINSIELHAYLSSKKAAVGDIYVHAMAADPRPLDPSDYQASAPSLVCIKSAASITTGWQTFTLTTTGLSLGGVLALRLTEAHLDAFSCMIPPTTYRYYRFAMWDYGTHSLAPYLVIDYSPASQPQAAAPGEGLAPSRTHLGPQGLGAKGE